MAGADPGAVSERARERGREAVGSLGSGNHYLEVQYVDAIQDTRRHGLRPDPEQVVVSIHCGSRGLGHQTPPILSPACWPKRSNTAWS
jgi:tRNA-splicing ligase RtcB